MWMEVGKQQWWGIRKEWFLKEQRFLPEDGGGEIWTAASGKEEKSDPNTQARYIRDYGH